MCCFCSLSIILWWPWGPIYQCCPSQHFRGLHLLPIGPLHCPSVVKLACLGNLSRDPKSAGKSRTSIINPPLALRSHNYCNAHFKPAEQKKAWSSVWQQRLWKSFQVWRQARLSDINASCQDLRAEWNGIVEAQGPSELRGRCQI